MCLKFPALPGVILETTHQIISQDYGKQDRVLQEEEISA